jgi:hypothetical protein
MTSPSSARPLLDAQTAAFLLRPGVSITAATRDERNVPRIGRCLGCRVSPDLSSVTVLIASRQYRAFFDALRATRAIAVVCSLPSTHRTMQLKGNEAVIEPLAPGDAEIVARYIDSFVIELTALGYAEDLVRAYHWCDPAELYAARFMPAAAFEQTPGPGAGAPLARAA